MTVSRSAYQDLVKENEGLKEQLDAARERENYLVSQRDSLIVAYDHRVAEADQLRRLLEDTRIAASASALECQTKLLAQAERERRLREALERLYEETADYIRINNLGDVHHNGSMKMARAALASPQEPQA